MGYTIKKAAVIGSGTMGSGIATLLAGVGVEVVLLDIPAPGTQPGDSPEKRNAVVLGNLKGLQKMKPSPLFSPKVLDRLVPGNIDDHLEKIADADWVIEVVVENLAVKRELMAKVALHVKPETIISTNTSGLPIKAIAEGLGNDFSRRFLGTHFFNPPRYLYLLEVIPHDNTDPEIVRFMVDYATHTLGKGVVICQDTPNFIGNRFMSMLGMQAMNDALDNKLTVEEIDALTGPLIGRPKTATFNLNDLVGFDVAVHIARNLYAAIPDDPAREVLNHPRANQICQYMLDHRLLGRKTDGGFYQMRRKNGDKELWALNLKTLDYDPPGKPEFESVEKHSRVNLLGERIRLLMHESDRAGEFLWHHHAFYLAYASNRVPEITDSIVNVDNAQKWGFAHEMGPFEIWDAIGVAETIEPFEKAGYPVADWVRQMVASGKSTFYQRDDTGQVVAYYSPQAGDYVPLAKDPREIKVAVLKAHDKQVAGNGSATVYDMGDGAALLEFHSKALAIDADFLAMAWRALELLDSDFDALVIGHDGERFCTGANLLTVMTAVQNGQFSQLEGIIRDLQHLTQAMRCASKPVVTAPFNMALGGGAELMMAGARIVAHMELYAGQVEAGVGVIPAGGGCKELLRRAVNPVMESSPHAEVLPHLQKVFEAIATCKVSASALEAREMGFLEPADVIVMNRAHLLGTAKRLALHMAADYQPLKPGKIYAAGRDAHAALLIGIEGFRESGSATDHDAHVARKLAYVLTGGAISSPGWVDEQVILDLERDAFMSLAQEAKTLDRIAHMLQYNKPLRN